jgi:hypothetical protein
MRRFFVDVIKRVRPEIGDLTHRDPAIAEAHRRNFAKLWDSTKAEARKLGWRRINPGTIAELYVDEGACASRRTAVNRSNWNRRFWPPDFRMVTTWKFVGAERAAAFATSTTLRRPSRFANFLATQQTRRS